MSSSRRWPASLRLRAKTGRSSSIYVKIILPVAGPAKEAPVKEAQPVVESWIAKELRKRGETKLRAVTRWIRLAEDGEKITHVWNATVDGKGWGCPVAGRVAKRTADGKVQVSLVGWSPVGADIKGDTLPAEIGSRQIAIVDAGRIDQTPSAYFAILVAPAAKAGKAD